MPDQLQLRGGTTTEHNTFTGASKEVTIDTTKKTAVVHDGATAGGNPLMREDGANSALALGSQGTPSLKFTGDTNTGIYSPGADQVAISTNGTGRLFVDASGNVGVGTAPDQRLTLSSTGSTTINIYGQGRAAAFSLGVNATGSLINEQNNLPLVFNTNNTERLRITSDGKLGLGTSSPAVKLSISDTGTTPSFSTFNGGNSAAITSFAARAGLELIAYQSVSGSPYTKTSAVVANSDGTVPSELEFWTKTNGQSSPAARLKIDSSGNVGVGTTSPGEMLEIYSASDHKLKVSRAATSIELSQPASASPMLNASGTGVALRFGINDTETARIDSSGRLGIGTSSPQVLAQISSSDGGSNPVLGSATGIAYITTVNTAFGMQFGINGSSGLGWIQQGRTDGTATAYNLLLNPVGGNVGIGTTLTGNSANKLSVRSDSANSIVDALLLNNGSVDNAAGTGVRINFSGVSETNSDIRYAYIESATASINNDHYIAFGTNSAAATPVERARITSSGQLLVGTSTSIGQGATTQIRNDSNGYALALQRSTETTGPARMLIERSRGTVGSPSALQDDDIIFEQRFYGYEGSGYQQSSRIAAEVDGTVSDANDSVPGRLVFSTTADGAASPTERMRINNAGNLNIGRTSDLAITPRISVESANFGIGINTTNGGAGNEAVRFYNAGTAVGTISTSGSATAYNTSSDYRLKENVTAVTDGITRLQQLKPSRFNFIADPDATVDGFLAHEVQTVVPEAVTGEKDAVDADGNPEYQGIDQSKLVPLLTAALQEAIAKIETLEAKVAALEAN